MRAKEFIAEAIPLDQLRSMGSPETQADKDIAARLKQSMSSKPRNFVSKNAKMGGAGAHKDKKRAEKQGDVKHKAKQYEEGVAEAEIPSMYSKQVSPGMEHRARYKCPNCGIANKVQDWAANDNECPTCLEPLPYGLNQMPLKYQAEKAHNKSKD